MTSPEVIPLMKGRGVHVYRTSIDHRILETRLDLENRRSSPQLQERPYISRIAIWEVFQRTVKEKVTLRETTIQEAEDIEQMAEQM
jgi:hypothetical protein